MSNDVDSAPALCECGCGKPAPIITKTVTSLGYKKGEPGRFIRGHRLVPPIETRFWSKVQKTEGCWLWTAARFHNGYGAFRYEGGQWRAHRVAYTWLVGPIPDGMEVCHMCDNPACVRPDHLFLGTRKENAEDMVAKERAAVGDKNASRLHPDRLRRGEAHGRAKVTEQQVREIRKLAAQGVPHRAIAAQFGLTSTPVLDIIHRKHWAHVED